MALNPILLSKAEVIHQPIPSSFASVIHCLLPLNPPTKLGFNIMNCGRTVSKSLRFFSRSMTPMSSSSNAIGIGVAAHKASISDS